MNNSYKLLLLFTLSSCSSLCGAPDSDRIVIDEDLGISARVGVFDARAVFFIEYDNSSSVNPKTDSFDDIVVLIREKNDQGASIIIYDSMTTPEARKGILQFSHPIEGLGNWEIYAWLPKGKSGESFYKEDESLTYSVIQILEDYYSTHNEVDGKLADNQVDAPTSPQTEPKDDESKP